MSSSSKSHQQEQLEIMLSARCYSLFWVVTPEEETADELLALTAAATGRQIYFWNISRGWSDLSGAGTAKGNPMQALDRVEKAPSEVSAIFVFRDLAALIAPKNGGTPANQLPIVRELKNLASEAASDRRTLVLLSHETSIPVELREEATVVDLGYPDPKEIANIIDTLVAKKIKLTPDQKEQLIRSCQGLTQIRIRRILAKCLVKYGKIDFHTIDEVLEEKKQSIRITEILELIENSQLPSVGGLDNLKNWLVRRQNAFSSKAREFGLPYPKGVLLAGIQGTGKSLSAKTIAHNWQLPLLRLDTGRLFGTLVGESESRVRQMIKLVEAAAPCVLWIEEIDKAFGNIASGSDGDSGTSRRVFGSLITWMQEKTTPVFIVATCNRLDILPAELIRKGRFDEIFFINLPTDKERQEIFAAQLKARNLAVEPFDLVALASLSDKFSGAEIEAAIVDGMYEAFYHNEQLTTQHIARSLSNTVPLASIAAEQIDSLKVWAARSGAKSASIDYHLSLELKQMASKFQHPLEDR